MVGGSGFEDVGRNEGRLVVDGTTTRDGLGSELFSVTAGAASSCCGVVVAVALRTGAASVSDAVAAMDPTTPTPTNR